MPHPRRKLVNTLLVSTALVLLAGLVAQWWVANLIFRENLGPVARSKAEVVGETLAARLEQAMDLGIPLTQVEAMDELLTAMLGDDRQISEITLDDREGGRIFSWRAAWASDDTARETGISVPVMSGNGVVGKLTLVTADHYLSENLRRLAVDLALAFLASLVILREFLRLVCATPPPTTGLVRASPQRRRCAKLLLGVILGMSLVDWPLMGLANTSAPVAEVFTILAAGGGAALVCMIMPWVVGRIPAGGLLAMGIFLIALLLIINRNFHSLPPMAFACTAGGLLGLCLGCWSETLAVPHRTRPAIQDLFKGLGVGFIIGQFSAIALSPLHSLIIAMVGIGAGCLALDNAPPPAGTLRPPREPRLIILGLGAALPIYGLALAAPLGLWLPLWERQLVFAQQAVLLGAMAFVSALSIPLGLSLSRRWGGGLVVAVGGFSAGTALTSVVFDASPERFSILVLLMAMGVGLSLGGQRSLSLTLCKGATPPDIGPRMVAFLGAPGLIIGPGLSLLGSSTIGVVETLAAGGILLIIATSALSVGLLMLDPADFKASCPESLAGNGGR